MNDAALKPWPSDAVMIVAADAGTEIRANMDGVVKAECRDCGAELAADTYTVNAANALPIRRGRPVMFFCSRCCVKYDFASITHMHDHAGVTGKRTDTDRLARRAAEQ